MAVHDKSMNITQSIKHAQDRSTFSGESNNVAKPALTRESIGSIMNMGGSRSQVSAAGTASPAYAQTNGYAAPMQQQPAYTTPMQQPAYTTPMQQQPAYTTPMQQQPAYTTPMQQQPAYTTPMQSQPAYTTPMQQQPAYTTPMQSQPAYTTSMQSQPAYTTPMQQPQQPVQTAPIPQPAPAARPAMVMPQLQNPIMKGQKVNLLPLASAPSFKCLFGWETASAECDIDVSAFLLNGEGKVPGDDWFVFYGQPASPDQSVTFRGDAAPDREAIDINSAKLSQNVEKIVFVLTINEAFTKNLNFSMVRDAYVRIFDQTGNKELVSFKLTDYYNNVISIMIGELYKHGDNWKFNAVGNGVAKDLAGLCELYGVQVI